MTDEASTKKGFFSRRITKGATIGGAFLFFVVGILFWGGFNTAMEATNTLEFCITCHEMEENVYQEYKPSIHHSNRSGVRATCSDCHVPKPWIHKMVRKVKASNEVWHKLLGTIDTPEKFDGKRLTLAKNVWKTMKETDSRECRNCHNLESMNPAFQKPRARKQHLNAMKEGQTCIDCHKGIAHKEVRNLLTDEEIDALEAPNPEFIREVPQLFLDGLALVETQEKAAEEKAATEKAKAKEKKKAAKAAEKQRIKDAVDAAVKAAEKKHIDDAVKAALATGATVAAVSTTASDAPVAASTAGTGVDWSDASERDITIFYPGQSSMEWVLTGKDHGGARPFVKLGDTCVTCHDRETDKMGAKIVSGELEKLEPKETLIPGKRGSIPVNVKAVHDGENLYMRFEWENSEHNPVPFVDGGKMDPENPMKLAIMFTGDGVEHAGQSGCWVSCHHDANNMPHNPGQDVTKYLKESRTKVEVAGRRGKKRGGWDKRKTDEEVLAELEAGHFMDIIRYKSGKNVTEDGHLLADREMTGEDGTEFIASLEGDTWVVEVKRKLNSGKPGDIDMSALDKLYNFGFAIHDDHTDSRFHHVSLGYKLGFDNDKADLNIKKQDVVAPVATEEKAPAAPASATKSSSVNWDNSPEREITIFYPGQSSMEWVLTGKDHGGARPFVKLGDTCVTCHDRETDKMGAKIVSGELEKLEPKETLIPGKRGSIPVNVQASYDAENLYMRFEWENGEHNPVPFVEGGKMDAENPMKLAIMFTGDGVEYAGQSGCWVSCHHDANNMPHNPGQDVTKYLKESRTKIEVKGRRGKKRGGWDKRKTDEEIVAELEAGHFMDIVRYKSGKNVTEDGHLLADREMTGGEGTEFIATLSGDTWVVEMSRKLNTGKAGDVKMEMGKQYNFGFAIHDDHTDSRFHHVSLGYKLGFDDEKAEVNAVKQ